MPESQPNVVKICRRKQSFPTKTDCKESPDITDTDTRLHPENMSNPITEGIKDKKVFAYIYSKVYTNLGITNFPEHKM